MKGLRLVENQKLAWAENLESYSDWHEFRIPWDRPCNWNEVCSWVVTQFGPPGDRYITHAEDDMTFLFRDAKDYEWMALRWS